MQNVEIPQSHDLMCHNVKTSKSFRNTTLHFLETSLSWIAVIFLGQVCEMVRFLIVCVVQRT